MIVLIFLPINIQVHGKKFRIQENDPKSVVHSSIHSLETIFRSEEAGYYKRKEKKIALLGSFCSGKRYILNNKSYFGQVPTSLHQYISQTDYENYQWDAF